MSLRRLPIDYYSTSFAGVDGHAPVLTAPALQQEFGHMVVLLGIAHGFKIRAIRHGSRAPRGPLLTVNLAMVASCASLRTLECILPGIRAPPLEAAPVILLLRALLVGLLERSDSINPDLRQLIMVLRSDVIRRRRISVAIGSAVWVEPVPDWPPARCEPLVAPMASVVVGTLGDKRPCLF